MTIIVAKILILAIMICASLMTICISFAIIGDTPVGGRVKISDMVPTLVPGIVGIFVGLVIGFATLLLMSLFFNSEFIPNEWIHPLTGIVVGSRDIRVL